MKRVCSVYTVYCIYIYTIYKSLCSFSQLSERFSGIQVYVKIYLHNDRKGFAGQLFVYRGIDR